jgi:hypothetical protein
MQTSGGVVVHGGITTFRRRRSPCPSWVMEYQPDRLAVDERTAVPRTE